jgi:hypothetical protein
MGNGLRVAGTDSEQHGLDASLFRFRNASVGVGGDYFALGKKPALGRKLEVSIIQHKRGRIGKRAKHRAMLPVSNGAQRFRVLGHGGYQFF